MPCVSRFIKLVKVRQTNRSYLRHVFDYTIPTHQNSIVLPNPLCEVGVFYLNSSFQLVSVELRLSTEEMPSIVLLKRREITSYWLKMISSSPSSPKMSTENVEEDSQQTRRTLVDSYLASSAKNIDTINPSLPNAINAINSCFLCQFGYSPFWFPVTVKRNGIVSTTEDSPRVCLRCFLARKLEKLD